MQISNLAVQISNLMQISNLAVQISNLDSKHFCLPWQTWDLLPPAIKEPPKLKIQNGDDDDLSYHRC